MTFNQYRILLHGYAHTALNKVFTMTIREWFATAASHKAKKADKSEEVPTANGLQTVCHVQSTCKCVFVMLLDCQSCCMIVLVVAATAATAARIKAKSRSEARAYQH